MQLAIYTIAHNESEGIVIDYRVNNLTLKSQWSANEKSPSLLFKGGKKEEREWRRRGKQVKKKPLGKDVIT